MNDVLLRLSSIIDNDFNKSRPDFARAVGKTPDTLRAYFQKDSMPGGDFLAAMLRLGYSSDWLLTGEGSRYADNEAGRALQHKANAHNPERDDNVGAVLDSRLLMTSKVYTEVITAEEVQQLELITAKLRKLVK